MQSAEIKGVSAVDNQKKLETQAKEAERNRILALEAEKSKEREQQKKEQVMQEMLKQT